MEFLTLKRSRSRRKRGHLKRRRRNHVKFEVNFPKRQKLISEHIKVFNGRNTSISNTMHANSFWENYSAAQEWQKRHNVTWWRTRCFALEHENQVLRDKLRSLAYQNAQPCSSNSQKTQDCEDQYVDEEDGTGFIEESESENLEFHVNEDMMSFLEQSIRHKIELRKKREAESLIDKEKEENENSCIQGGAAWMHARNNNAKLLYGEASPMILAMETALQTTIDRHKDKARPQCWPIIPLKP